MLSNAPKNIGAVAMANALRKTGDQNISPVRLALRAMAKAVTAAERSSNPPQTAIAAVPAPESQGAAVRRWFISTAASAKQPTTTIPPPETLLSRPAASSVRRIY